MPNFIKTCKKIGIIELLKLIGRFCFKHYQHNENVHAVMNSLKALFINFQKSDVGNDDYIKEFQA